MGVVNQSAIVGAPPRGCRARGHRRLPVREDGLTLPSPSRCGSGRASSRRCGRRRRAAAIAARLAGEEHVVETLAQPCAPGPASPRVEVPPAPIAGAVVLRATKGGRAVVAPAAVTASSPSSWSRALAERGEPSPATCAPRAPDASARPTASLGTGLIAGSAPAPGRHAGRGSRPGAAARPPRPGSARGLQRGASSSSPGRGARRWADGRVCGSGALDTPVEGRVVGPGDPARTKAVMIAPPPAPHSLWPSLVLAPAAA
jgi:hypothetical protein